MKNILKGKTGSVLIIIATIILAAVAMFTAVRLYQLRNQAVAPNVPSSIPLAAGQTCGGISNIVCSAGEVCIYSDGTTNAPNPDATGTCQEKGGTPSASPTASTSGKPTPSGSPSTNICGGITGRQCPAGQICIYSDGTTRAPFPDASGTCQANQKLVVASPSPTPAATAPSACQALAFNVSTTTPTPSPSPSPSVSPSPSPSASPTSTPGPTVSPTPTSAPNSCNGTCGSNFNCASDLVCYNGFCRNPSCTGSTNCICGTSAPSIAPTPAPSLPSSGTDWPTLAAMSIGIIVIISSILLAL